MSFAFPAIRPDAEAGTATVVAFTADAAARSLIGTAAAAAQLSALVAAGTIEDALRHCVAQEPPAILIVDLDGVAQAEAALAELVEGAPKSRILCLGSASDLRLYHRLLRLGASDYQPKPLEEAPVTGWFARPYRPHAKPAAAAPPPPQPSHSLILVSAPRGGLGTSLVAQGLAYALAETRELPTALIDGDLAGGTQALNLDLTCSTAMRDALAEPARLDDLLMQRAVTRITARLGLLAMPPPGQSEPPAGFDAAALKLLIDRLLVQSHVVLDLPRHALGQAAGLLKAADILVLVVDRTLAGLRDITRLTQSLQQINPGLRLLAVENRVGKPFGDDVGKREVERVLGGPQLLSLPWDHGTVTLARRTGRPVGVVAPRSPLKLCFDRLALTCLPGQGDAPKPRRRLFGR